MMKIYKYALLLAAAAASLSACSDKHDYIPADPESADCMGVYFDADNEQSFIFVPGEPAVIAVKMHRFNADAAADVPLICSSTLEGVVCPPSVHFDAGSADAVAEISCDGLPSKQTAVISVDIPQEYIHHYAATLFNYQAQALKSQWEPANADGSPVKLYFTTVDYVTYYNNTPQPAVFQPIDTEMEVLPGARRIRLHDFIGSGVTMEFSMSPSPYSDFVDGYRLTPVDNFITAVEAYEDESYGDEWYNAWYLLTDPDEDGDQDYATLSLTDIDGNPASVTYPMFMMNSDSYAFEYSYAMFKSNTRKFNSASLGFGGTPSAGITIPSYFYVYFRWDGESGL